MSLRTCCVKNLSPVQLLDHVLFHLKVGKSSFFQNVSRPIIIKLNINYESTPQLPPYSSTSEPFYNVTTLVSPVTDTYLSVHSFHSSLSSALRYTYFHAVSISISPDLGFLFSSGILCRVTSFPDCIVSTVLSLTISCLCP